MSGTREPWPWPVTSATGNEQARAHNGLGAALLAKRLTSQARAHYVAALALASESGDPYQQDRARDGLAFSERAYA
jgi:hypothetical protein